jgi:hypothetical protein
MNMTEDIDNEIEIENEATEVDTSDSGRGTPVESSSDENSGGDDELSSYSKGVQSRIKKLTERYRQEERDRQEAVRLSQTLLEENQKLKQRMQALDTGYLSEYGARLQSQQDAAKRQYKEAYESGDSDRLLEAQELLSRIAIEQQRYGVAKARAEQQSRAPVERQEQEQARPVQQQPAQQQRPKPDPRAQSWAEKNKWFGDDRVMTTAAFTIHQQLVEEEGFDPQSEEYYTEVDRRIRREFPHKFQAAKKSGGGSQVASAGNSASRSTTQGRRSVKLTHSQVAIARKLGVPLEEYAKYVKE